MNMKKTLLLLTLLVALINSQACSITGCQTCTLPSTCTDCDEAMGYDSVINSGAACDCLPEFYLDSASSQCQACEAKFANCDTCTQSSCTKCKQDYSLANQCKKPCEDIFEGCSACAGLVCSACDAARNYTFNQGDTACVCASKFIKRVSTDKFCVPCYYLFDGCDVCTNTTACQTCKAGFTLAGGTCSCSASFFPVSKGSYYLSSICISCRNLDNCNDCSSSSQCTECVSDAYYLDGAVCSSCSQAHTNCQACDKDTRACTRCRSPYLQVAGSCSRCDEFMMGCTACTSATSCTSCDTGNNFKGIQNPASSCECIDESYRNSTGCHLCRLSMSNCNRCSSATTCTNCVRAFFVNAGSCSPCGVGCLACSSETVCVGCDTYRYFVDFGDRICRCYDGLYLSGTSCESCDDAITGCRYCGNEYECDECYQYQGFSLNSETKKCYCSATRYYNFQAERCHLCSDVLSNCEACSNSTYCDQCATGYTEMHTFGPTQSTCEQCSTLMVGCLVCATPTVCTECDSANNFIFSGSSCQCAPAFYLNSGVCTLCTSFSPQCTTCDSSGCTACIASYFLNATSKLCQLCTSFSPQCTACTPTGCSACEEDYVVSSTSCARLCNIELCIDCFNSTTCMFCVVHATLNDDRTECNCNTGYFSDSTKCALCSTVIPNCAECESALKCTACQDGFVVDLETDQCAAFESALKMASILLVMVFAALSF